MGRATDEHPDSAVPRGTWHNSESRGFPPFRHGIFLAMIPRMRSTLAFGLCALLAACGGSLTTPDDGGTGNDSGPGSDAGKDGSPGQDGGAGPGCPASPPASGGACSPESIDCEYGSSPRPDCNQQFQCVGGHWQDHSSGTICPPPTDCPSTYASITPGNDCNPDGLACAYPGDGTCFCTTNFGVQKQTPAWLCVAATSQCPSPRPDIGSACSQPGQQCDYGSCQGGAALSCTGGVWTQVSTPCPL